jgi:membrane fusion protein
LKNIDTPTSPPPDDAQPAPLFRDQAVSAARSRMGSPAETFGLSSWLLTGFLGALLVAGFAFLFFTQYARVERVPGLVQPDAGAIKLTTTRAGVISRVFVKQGQPVPAGAPLMKVALDATVDGGHVSGLYSTAAAQQEDAIGALTLARRASAQEQQAYSQTKQAGVADEIRRLEAQLELQRGRQALSEQNVASARELFEKRLLPAIQLRQREDNLLEAKISVSSLERQLDEARTSLAQARIEARRAQAEEASAQADIAKSRAELMEKRATFAGEGEIILTAERAGRVAALTARAGQTAAPGEQLAILLPKDSKLTAELWVSSKAIGFVRKGDRVRLMYEAFPYQRFGVGGGTITEIADAPVAPADQPAGVESGETKELLYRVVATLDRQSVAAYEREWPLMPGMRLSGEIILDSRSLIDWVLDPILAMRARSKVQ